MSDANIWSPDAESELVTAIGALLRGTSTTAVTVTDTGTRTFTTQASLFFRAGDWLVITKQTDPDVWMAGSVVSYNATTGVLVFAPEVSSGAGSHSLWNISLSGVWVPIQWNGGIVGAATTFEDTVTCEAAVTLQAAVEVQAKATFKTTPISTAGSFGVSQHISLADANAVLTPAQLFNNTLLIEPTAARVLTLPTATEILTFLVGYEIGSYFDFTIINDTDFSVTVAGNSGIVQLGRTLSAEGSSSFRVTVDSLTIVSVANIGSPVPKVGAGDIDSSAVQAASADITLASNSPRLQSITMSTEGNSVILPAATGVIISSPTFVILNDGFYPFGIKDNAGNLLRVLEAGGSVTLSLITNATIAGKWLIAGDKLKSGMITAKLNLATTFSSASIINSLLDLATDITIHFANITSNGFAVFAYDNLNRAIGAPVTISTGANMRVCATFRIDDNSFVVFYSATSGLTNLNSVVVTRVGVVLTVGTPAAITVANSTLGVDDNYGAPKIVQMDSTLYAATYAGLSGSSVTSVVGMQISAGVTCTWGTPAVTLTITDCVQAQIVFPLSTTTFLLLYKTGTTTPYAGKAVVVSVTNANPPVCTVGTAGTTLPSRYTAACSAQKIATNLYGIVDDGGNANNAELMLISVSGVAVAMNTTTVLFTYAGIGARTTYISDGGSKWIPKLHRVSDSSLLWWGHVLSGASSRVVIASIAYPAVTVGTLITDSWNSINTNTGRLLALGVDEFLCAAISNTDTGSAGGVILIPHKISGNVLSVGKSLALSNMLGDTGDGNKLVGIKLTSGQYAITNLQAGTTRFGGGLGIQMVKTDGINIIDNGVIYDYISSNRGASGKEIFKSGNRLILLQAAQEIVGSDPAELLRLVNIDTVA